MVYLNTLALILSILVVMLLLENDMLWPHWASGSKPLEVEFSLSSGTQMRVLRNFPRNPVEGNDL
mgnify:CR=1 FL=1